MFIMTPEMSKRVDEYAKKMMEEQKKKKEDYLAARDARLKSFGLEDCDEYFVQKIAEVKKIAGSVEEETVKEAKEMLKQIQGTSEAGASEVVPESAAPKSTTVAEPSAQMNQIPDLPSIIPTPLSPSNDLEEPNTSDLPKWDSPSNLFSLERHLGGEITKTPQKATKSVPKKIDLVNQQPPQPFLQIQTTPEPTFTQTSIQTQTQTPQPTQTSTPTQTHTSPLQMIIPKYVAETVAAESVQVTESEPSVSIIVSEPTQKPTQNPTLTTNDQPSSSPSIQILDQTPPNLLESEYLEAELLQISKDMQKLVQLRRAPTLLVAYEDQWATLKTRASDLLNTVSQKCIKIQAAAVKHYFSAVHSAEEGQAPLLFLANAPFFLELDYLSREAMMFKLLKQKVLKQQEEAKAREDLLFQRQLALEATLKEQAELIEKLMNKQANP